MGHTVVRLGGGEEFLENVKKTKVHIVFNISEGLGNYRSREAQLPSVLEMLDIPYIGSDPLCLAMSLDKPLTKKIAKSIDIPTPDWIVVGDICALNGVEWDKIKFPCFIKPAQEGSSKGVRLNSKADSMEQAEILITKLLYDYKQPVMVEEFIDGDEITVGIIGNFPPQVLGIMRVLPNMPSRDFIYSLEVKRDWRNMVNYECPAHILPKIAGKIEEYSLRIFTELTCRDFARVDFKVSKQGIPYFLEINPLAGLNPVSSDLPIMARLTGMDYIRLIEKIFNSAQDRFAKCILK
jgi:D-alanine-D-alanine ligase